MITPWDMRWSDLLRTYILQRRLRRIEIYAYVKSLSKRCKRVFLPAQQWSWSLTQDWHRKWHCNIVDRLWWEPSWHDFWICHLSWAACKRRASRWSHRYRKPEGTTPRAKGRLRCNNGTVSKWWTDYRWNTSMERDLQIWIKYHCASCTGLRQ